MPVIQTKLSPPGLPATTVARPRLHARLEAHTGRLILVSAPAGFGKTVLVVDWLSRNAAPTAWLAVDRSDNDPARFFTHLGAAVAGLDLPGADRAARLIGDVGAGGGSLSPALLDAFADLGPEPIIVLDDIHELESQAVLSGLEALARGPGPRLVLVTRIDPPLALGRLRVSGQLLELRERDLRFTTTEAVAFFDQLIPGVLDRTLVERVGARTEGWAAGLRLAAIALQETDDPAGVVDSFTGSHRYVVDYLLEEAVERQSPAVQRFLMDTSILRRFTPDVCVAVTGEASAVARLDEVEASNLFLVSLGEDRRWYRYHHLFAELLEFRLRREEPERLDLLHRRASEWFDAAGDVHLALEHAAAMTDRARLLELLDRHALDMLARSELATLRHWMNQVSEPLAQPYPIVLAALGWLRILTERSPDLRPVLSAIENALEGAPDGYDPVRKRYAAVQLDVLTAFAARFAGRLEEALEVSERVLNGLSEDEAFVRGLVVFNMARAHMGLGEPSLAAGLLERSIEYNQRAGNLYLVLAGLGQTAAVLAQSDGVYPALATLDSAEAFAGERGLTRLPAYSTVLYQRGHVHYLADELEQAETAFAAAVELGRAMGFPEGHANGLIGLARIAMTRRDIGRAESLLTECGALEQAQNVLLMDTTVALERARLAFARQLTGTAAPVPDLDAETEADGARWNTVREATTMLALWQAVRGDRQARAAVLADRLLAESEPRNRGPAQCAALLARALLPGREDRWDLLDRALQLAAGRGYVRPVLDGGEPVRALLQASLARPLSAVARSHARRLLDRFDAQVRSGTVPTDAGLVEALTEREEEVLAHLCEGLSNKGIARAMFVSVETVKTHLKHLYGKLGATSRKEAVSRARELGLSPRATAPGG